MNEKPRLLDLFCGAGGAAMGYHRAGFKVIGVDIEPQPYYPFEFHQVDAFTYPLDDFDAYHASPPCQKYSVSISPLLGYRKEHPDLIAPIRSALLKTSKPFVIENVSGSPLVGYIKLDGTMFGLKTRKERWFELHGFDIPFIPKSTYKRGMVKNGKLVGLQQHSYYENEIVPTKEALAVAYDISWIPSRHWLRQAIPPAYTEYIGKYLMEVIVNKQKPFTGGEFENLLDKASQPLELKRKPAPEEVETSESQTSGDCTESRTHSDSPEGT